MAPALVCFFPGRCKIRKWNSCSFSNHLANCPSGSLNDCSHDREPWSVLRVNSRPNRYGRNCCVNTTTASNSRRVTQYRRSDLLSVRLANAMTCSWPCSSSWDSTPPIPVLLASVSRIKGFVKSGKARTGAVHSLWRNSANAAWHSTVHSKVAVFSVNRCNGLAILAKLRTNRR